MPGHHRQPPVATPVHPPASPTSRGTAKYTNKDGSKFITVPKANAVTDSAEPSPTLTSPTAPSSNGPLQAVNRKKQKRRAKAAAKLAAEQAQHGSTNGLPSPAASASNGPSNFEQALDDNDEEAEPYPGSNHPPQQNGHLDPSAAMVSKKSKKKKKKGAAGEAGASELLHQDEQHSSAPLAPPARASRASGMSKEKIWNTSSQEERERIKEFWLGLGEDERKSLVKVEKDAVLKKMKEQQKHTCSCTVCGRKRTAIEEELEGLYDAYYEELENFANHPHQHGDGPPMLTAGHFGGVRPSRGLPSNYSGQPPSHGRIVEHVGDVDDDEEDLEADEEYDDELEEEDEYSEDAPSEQLHRSDYATDFFNFGNSLTVQGGILTVADDLLKNDGKKFIEMMEQLAERRMAREEYAKEQYSRGYAHTNGGGYHNHPPAEEDEYDDEEEDEDDFEDDDYGSEEEEDTMTEEQRMEEGRRMFQIFAARMFEQRVLTAYREKVAKERQEKLIEELDEENLKDSQRKAKKAKEAQKRKEKALKKKEAQAEEKARKEAEKAAEEAALLAEEERRAEEQRLKLEEKRKKKEAAKKAEEEERARKEADRQRRALEAKEKQVEAERKAREVKEKQREESRLKEKEARERREREARERKDQQDKEKREKEAKVKSERDAKEKQRQEDRAAQKAAVLATAVPITLPKRPSQHPVPTAIPVLPQQASANVASPKIPVATPAVPKAPTPMRPRQMSQQGSAQPVSQVASQQGSIESQNASPHPITPVHTSPGAPAQPSKAGSSTGNSTARQSSHPASPLQHPAKSLPTHPGPFNVQPMGMPPPPPGFSPIPPGFGSQPVFPHMGAFAGPGPNMIPMPPPGFNGPIGHAFQQMPQPPPGFGLPGNGPFGMNQPFGMPLPKDNVQSHSRNPSASMDSNGIPGVMTQPIARPAPIGRPGSVVHGQRASSGSPGGGNPQAELEDAQHHLGSSALLDDSDEPLQDFSAASRRVHSNTVAPGPNPNQPRGYAPVPFAADPLVHSGYNIWTNASGALPPNTFSPAPPPGFGPVAWGPPAQPAPSAFDSHARSSGPRSVMVRKLLIRACQELAGSQQMEKASADNGFLPLEAIQQHVSNTNQEQGVMEDELLEMCDTEGNTLNGGGTFDIRKDSEGKTLIRWSTENGSGHGQHRPLGAPGQSGAVIGSPVIGSGSLSGWGAVNPPPTALSAMGAAVPVGGVSGGRIGGGSR